MLRSMSRQKPCCPPSTTTWCRVAMFGKPRWVIPGMSIQPPLFLLMAQFNWREYQEYSTVQWTTVVVCGFGNAGVCYRCLSSQILSHTILFRQRSLITSSNEFSDQPVSARCKCQIQRKTPISLAACCTSQFARFRCHIPVQWWYPLSNSQNKPGSQHRRVCSTRVWNTQRSRPSYGDRHDPGAFVSILLSWSSSWRRGAGIWCPRTSGWGRRKVSSVSCNEYLQDLYEVKYFYVSTFHIYFYLRPLILDVTCQEAVARARVWHSGVCSASWLSWNPWYCSAACSPERNSEWDLTQTTTEHNVALGKREIPLLLVVSLHFSDAHEVF